MEAAEPRGAGGPHVTPRPTPGVLRYQGARTLDRCGAYRTAVQLRVPGAPGSGSMFAGLKRTGLDVYLDPAPAFHYDLEGRLEKVVDFTRYVRRSHAHRLLETRKAPPEKGGGLRRTNLGAADADALCDEASARVGALARAAARAGGGGADLEFARPDPEGALATLVPRLLEAARFDARRARASAEAFARIYRPVPILPPDHYRALVLQATEGCLYNRCRFCGFYRGIEFRPKGAGEFLEHVRAARGYWGRALPARRSVFLGQANALTLGMRELETIFEIIRRELPEGLFPALARRGVDSFLDAFTGKRKSVEELRTLHRLGLHRVYIGMETAHAELLAWLRKPGSPADVVETVRRLREAGLRVGVILLAGIGGRSFAEAHVRRSVEAVRSMGLGWADRVYVSPLVNYAGSTYLDEAAKAGFEPLDDDALGEQTARLAKGIREGHGRRSGPPVAPYRVEHFVY